MIVRKIKFVETPIKEYKPKGKRLLKVSLEPVKIPKKEKSNEK